MWLDLRSTYFLRIWTYSSASEWPSPSPPSPHAALFSGGFLKTSISMNHRLFSAYYIMQLDKVTQGKLFWPRLRQWHNTKKYIRKYIWWWVQGFANLERQLFVVYWNKVRSLRRSHHYLQWLEDLLLQELFRSQEKTIGAGVTFSTFFSSHWMQNSPVFFVFCRIGFSFHFCSYKKLRSRVKRGYQREETFGGGNIGIVPRMLKFECYNSCVNLAKGGEHKMKTNLYVLGWNKER